MSDILEVLRTVDRLHGILADLMVRGLRSAGEAQVAPLEAVQQELDRIGASHLSGRIQALVDAIRDDDRGAARALLRAQTSLRLFERVLTLEHAVEMLDALLASQDAPEGA